MEKIQKKVDALRSKPQHVKEVILVVTVAVFAAILLTFWVGTFSVSKVVENSKPSENGAWALLKRAFVGAPASVTPVDTSKTDTTAQ